MEIKYQFFENERIFVQKFNGVFSVEKYMIFTRQLMNNPQVPNIDYVLIDFRDLDFSVILDDFEEVLERLTKYRKDMNEEVIKRNDICIIFWVSAPIPTVIAHLVKINLHDIDYNYCSTIENIMEYMDIPDSMSDINKVCRNLSETFEAQAGGPPPHQAQG